MKPTTELAHAARVDAVVARLQAALEHGEPMPALETLAGIAQLSAFHFHRVWRALTGEPLGRTMARLRLLRALQLLETPDRRVIDVALACGFDSAQSLARACRDALGATPGALRGDAALRAQARERLQGPATAQEAALEVSLVSLEPVELVALRRRGAFDALDAGYAALFDWATASGRVEAISGLYGVPRGDHRDLAPDAFEFDCAIALEGDAAPPSPMRRCVLAGGLHARLRHLGPYERIEASVDQLLARWWPASGFSLRDAPIHYAFLDDPEQVPAQQLRADIHLPLQPAG